MWVKLSSLIIKNRLFLIISIALITLFMGYKAKEVEMTYDFTSVVPPSDDDYKYFQEFKKTFGEDANILVIGMQDPKLFRLEEFKKFAQLSDTLSKIKGITQVISIANIRKIVKDTSTKKFVLTNAFERVPQSQNELDSMLVKVNDIKYYEGLIFRKDTKATLIAVYIDRKVLNSSNRQALVDGLMALCSTFSKDTGIEIHYAGLPYVRTIMVGKVASEFKLFLVLAAFVTSLIIFLFFRSHLSVLAIFLIIGTMVVWTMGILVLLGYKISILTGMVPALIIVISIPNSIYMFNKYHQEYKRHQNKIKAVSRVIQKVAPLILMTNATTAIGFLVFIFTGISILIEFGALAGIVVMATFLISIILLPSLFIYLPAPDKKQLRHLDLKLLRRSNQLLEYVVLRHRSLIYLVTFVVILISVYGVYKIKSISYMVDDLPESSNVKTDLAFFEQHFEGVMPLEIIIDFGKPKAVMKPSNLKKMEEFEEFLIELNNVSPPVSILNVVKGSMQAFYNEDPGSYRLPNNRERPFILKYFGKDPEGNEFIKAFVDSTGSLVRFTCKVADLGTTKTDYLVKKVIEPRAKEIFGDDAVKTKVTGTTVLFLKSNQFLIDGLTGSLTLAIFLIALLMAYLFKNIKMVLIALVPNIIPIIITTGIMGIFGIPIKPSTALIFSIAFGIAVDDTIHYLSKYKQDLVLCNGNILQAVIRSLDEAGVSMIYTSVVLFFGFIIFSFSDFGGTIALGILTSITLFFALITNLTILPALLLTFSKQDNRNLFPIVDRDPAELHIEEDINLDLQKLKKSSSSKSENQSEVHGV